MARHVAYATASLPSSADCSDLSEAVEEMIATLAHGGVSREEVLARGRWRFRGQPDGTAKMLVLLSLSP